MFKPQIYQNSTELAQLAGVPLYMHTLMDAAVRGKLNVFLQGDTGSGKTQLLRDMQALFGDKSLFILGRNDMDTRELFRQINPEFVRALREGRDPSAYHTLSANVQAHCIGVDELPNCVPAVRAQLFNLFDGYIEIDGKAYPLGSEYCIGIATGNVGQQFTESANELGRALKDRMHLIIDTDMYRPQPMDTLDILMKNRNPRVQFHEGLEQKVNEVLQTHKDVMKREVPFEKYLIAAYLVHGLDYVDDEHPSKIAMKSGWPNKIENHPTVSDATLILPISTRAAKSIITLSQALDTIVEAEGAKEIDPLDSMMISFKFGVAYSGVLNEAAIRDKYEGSKYAAMDAVIATTRTQFDGVKEPLAAGIALASEGKLNKKLMDQFQGRWYFARKLLEQIAEKNNEHP